LTSLNASGAAAAICKLSSASSLRFPYAATLNAEWIAYAHPAQDSATNLEAHPHGIYLLYTLIRPEKF
jgi:hypothetical protein